MSEHQQLLAELYSKGQARGLLATVLDPLHNAVAPPGLYSDATFTKAITHFAAFTALNDDFTTIINNSVRTAACLSRETLGTQRGAVIWHTMRGVGNMYHHAYVAIGNWTVPTGDPRAPVGGAAGNGTLDLTGLPFGYIGDWSFVYNSELLLPYVAGDRQIVTSPVLSDNFSKVRPFAGLLRVVSDTVSAGTLALNGNMAVGAIAATNDFCQTKNAKTTFVNTDLVQGSVTTKEGIKEVSVQDGIYTLMGPDINPSFVTPEQQRLNIVEGEFGNVASYILQGKSQTIQLNAPGTYVLGLAWCSWCDISVVDRGAAEKNWTGGVGGQNTANGINCTNIKYSAIDEQGDMTFNVSGSVTLTTVAKAIGQSIGARFTLNCTAVHIYAAAATSGYGIQYTTSIQRKAMLTFGDYGDNTLNFNKSQRFSADFDSKPDHTDYLTGKYIGTWFSFSIDYSGYVNFDMAATVGAQPAAWTGLAATWTAAGISFTFSAAGIAIKAATRGSARLGNIGPARVITYEGLTQEQRMRIDGTTLSLCIPQGVVAPFTQVAASSNEAAQNINLVALITELFNGGSFCKRNWTGKEYQRMLETEVPKISGERVMQIAQSAASPGNLVGAGSAAGIFGRLGSGIGAAIGGPVGSAIGSLGGSLVDSLAGSSGGRYYASAADDGMSAGQFVVEGRSAGQFSTVGQSGARFAVRRDRQY